MSIISAVYFQSGGNKLIKEKQYNQENTKSMRYATICQVKTQQWGFIETSICWSRKQLSSLYNSEVIFSLRYWLISKFLFKIVCPKFLANFQNHNWQGSSNVYKNVASKFPNPLSQRHQLPTHKAFVVVSTLFLTWHAICSVLTKEHHHDVKSSTVSTMPLWPLISIIIKFIKPMSNNTMKMWSLINLHHQFYVTNRYLNTDITKKFDCSHHRTVCVCCAIPRTLYVHCAM